MINCLDRGYLQGIFKIGYLLISERGVLSG
jgi:hypothetical protein